MTTVTTVAGRPLSDWSRDTRHGTWHALLPARSGDPALGALRVDRALLAPEGTRERLAAAVLAVGRLRLPGVLGTVDLVAEAGEVWLLTSRPPVPTVADLLDATGAATGDASGPDAGSVASVLNETAQTLLALHAAGLTHGALGTDTVVCAPDGVALLAESALGTVLGDARAAAGREADVLAWAALARTLADAWTGAGTPAADLFARCSATAESEGLAAARDALVAGRAALPADFLRRTALRAAVTATTPELTAAPTVVEPTAVEPTAVEPTADEPGAPVQSDRPEDRGPGAAGPDPTVLVPAADQGAPADAQLTMPSRARRARTPDPALPDEQATVLGKRHRTGPVHPAPEQHDLVPTATGADADEILLRFGPGVPVEGQEALRGRWSAAAPPPDPRERRRRRGWIATTALLTVVAVLLWLLLRPDPAPTVTAVDVQAPTGKLHCGQTADMVGVVRTDGRGGPVTYRWLRSDGHDTGELVRTAHSGERRVTVHLRWTVRGPGTFHGTARLRVAHQRTPVEGEATFIYVCS